MSFSWSIEDAKGNDLCKEFGINGQALGLSDDDSPVSLSEIRSQFANSSRYGKDFPQAARDAFAQVQVLVNENLRFWTRPEHECPNCKCERTPRYPFGFDIEQAKRFVAIPIDRVARAWGGY